MEVADPDPPSNDSERARMLRAYMAALDAGDYGTIVSLFLPAGMVTSPFLGTMRADEFFPQLARASSNNKITPIDVFVSESGANHAVAYFEYDWTMADGSSVVFKVMDLFVFASSSNQFASLEIISDTHPTRSEHGNKYQSLAES